jgi:hypothetical protein
MMTLAGIETKVVSPEEMKIENDSLVYQGKKVDLIYSRYDPESVKLHLERD